MDKKAIIVVTQDYGVAALALGKGARAIHQSGRWYTDENIDGLLIGEGRAEKEQEPPEGPCEAYRRG